MDIILKYVVVSAVAKMSVKFRGSTREILKNEIFYLLWYSVQERKMPNLTFFIVSV